MKNRNLPRFPIPVVACGLAALTFASFAGPIRAQGIKTVSAVHDTGSMFSKEAVEKATEKLRKLDDLYHVPIVVQTIESLKDEPIRIATLREARRSGGEGVFILLAKRNNKLEVQFSERYQGLFGKNDSQAISNAFVEEFRKGSFDDGLTRGVGLIETLLAHAREEGKPFPAARHEGLVLRNQVRLTLDGARKVIAGAEEKAKELGLKVNIAVVDDGGHLIAFERMDGARPASGYTATTKAVTAATFRAPSGPLPAGTATPDLLLNLSLQNAAAASGGKLTTLLGGVPVVVEGQVIAGVGVGGGTGEQDAQVARAGISGFLAELGGEAAKP